MARAGQLAAEPESFGAEFKADGHRIDRLALGQLRFPFGRKLQPLRCLAYPIGLEGTLLAIEFSLGVQNPSVTQIQLAQRHPAYPLERGADGTCQISKLHSV